MSSTLRPKGLGESEIQFELRNITRQFARKTILPHVEEDEQNERFRPEWIQELGRLGLTGIPLPEKWGGAGLGYSDYWVVLDELAQVNTGYAISLAVTGLTQVILDLFGNENQKKRYIPALAAGEKIGSFALSEAGSGSDAGSLRTTAALKGDHYILNGTKLWCTQADLASTLIVMARTGGPGPKGVSALILEQGTPGFSLGKREKKMGWSTSHTMELHFENVKIPRENLLSREGEGFKIAMTALDSGRITIAACAVGIAKAALRVAAEYSNLREQFGRKISEFQGVSFMLADMATQLEASELLVKQAAYLKDQGLPFSQQAAMAKLFATDAAMKITTDAVEVLGGAGYTREFPLERYMREAKAMQIVEGTNQIQRLVISRGILQNLQTLS